MNTIESISLREKILSATEEIIGRDVTLMKNSLQYVSCLKMRCPLLNWVGFIWLIQMGRNGTCSWTLCRG